jgi:hypothetical protein
VNVVPVIASLLFITSVIAGGLADTVVRAHDLKDLEQATAKDYHLTTVERVPDKLFESILISKSADAEWRALEHYSKLVDAGSSLEFFRSCYSALLKQPFLFYRRYMVGDDTALDRMLDALAYDFAAYERLTLGRYNEHREEYNHILSEISKQRVGLHGLRLERHNHFVQTSQRQFQRWRARYPAYLDRR